MVLRHYPALESAIPIHRTHRQKHKTHTQKEIRVGYRQSVTDISTGTSLFDWPAPKMDIQTMQTYRNAEDTETNGQLEELISNFLTFHYTQMYI